MAKPNYSFAKRQRDLAKEQKKEEKLQRKKAAAEESSAPDADPEVSIDDAEPEAPRPDLPRRSWRASESALQPYAVSAGSFAGKPASTRSESAVSCQRHDGDPDIRVMAAPSQNHPTQRRHIGKIPAPGQGDVFQRRLHIVGRVEIHPAQHRAKH